MSGFSLFALIQPISDPKHWFRVKVGRIISRLGSIVLLFRGQVHNLSLLLDPTLSYDSQVADMSRSTFNQLRLIAQIHPYLDEGSLRMLMQTLVISWIGAFLKADPETVWVQNAAARLVADLSKFDHINPAFSHLHRLSGPQARQGS